MRPLAGLRTGRGVAGRPMPYVWQFVWTCIFTSAPLARSSAKSRRERMGKLQILDGWSVQRTDLSIGRLKRPASAAMANAEETRSTPAP